VETVSKLAFYPTFAVGHSMGVRSACAFAHLKPEWVRGLILIDLGFSGAAGGGLGDELGTFIKILPTDFATREEARKFMEENCPDPAIAQYLMAVSKRDGNGRTVFPFDHAALIATIEAAKNTSVRKWVQELASRGMPILVLRGMNSLVWSHEEFEKEKQSLAAWPSVVFEELEGAGHGLPFEKRAWFVERLRKFAAQHLLQPMDSD
jgi:pimeloyl-ACP methyl ester carboxylesterase